MRNSTRASMVEALFSAGFQLSTPAQSATAVGMSNHVESHGLVQTVDYRPYAHFKKKRFHRDFYRYPYRHGFRHHYRPYYARDYYVYHRPGVRFGLELRKHRYHRHYGY